MRNTAADRTRSRLHVVAAVLTNARGEVLIAERPAHVHQGGLWEFPGGKVEDGEQAPIALAREMEEELGIRVCAARPLIQVAHDYPEREVLLDVWRIERWSGDARGREGQRIDWVAPGKLGERSFPPADAPILTALRLPSSYLITPEPGADREGFLATLDRLCAGGIRLVQLRAAQLGAAAYRDLAVRAREICHARGAWLLLNADPALAVDVGADGVHLKTRRLRTLRSRPLAVGFWVGASCHDAAELQRAADISADFALLSPVAATASHPQAAALGWSGFAALVRDAKLPVYALGGMQPADLEAAWAHGAQGIATIRGLWRA